MSPDSYLRDLKAFIEIVDRLRRLGHAENV